MNKEEVVGFLNDMVDALTWKRVGLLCLLGVVTVSLLVTFENRTTIFNQLVEKKPVESLTVPWELSETSKLAINELTTQKLIGAVLVTEVNLKKNKRTTRYWFARDTGFRQYVTNIIGGILPQAFFDTDRKNNDQMLSVLNNQFVCTPTVDTVFIRFLPDMPKTLPYVCRLAVPPFAGEFAGFITLGLTKQPSNSEIDAMKIELTRVAIELYLRDIDRKGRF